MGTAAAPASDADSGQADTEEGQAAQQVAADGAALRRFLAEQVRRLDAKVFVVVDSPLESHPLHDSPPDAATAPAVDP